MSLPVARISSLQVPALELVLFLRLLFNPGVAPFILDLIALQDLPVLFDNLLQFSYHVHHPDALEAVFIIIPSSELSPRFSSPNRS
jgi:hypothetical protein